METIASESPATNSPHLQQQSIPGRDLHWIYSLSLAAAIALWFVPLRTPLWLDETGTWWQINAGFSGLWTRQRVSFPAYTFILWLSSKIIGTSEIALRIPSILAMLGAVYLLYLAARELFDRDTAVTAAIIYCVHPVISFASIDVRPYAFAALAVNAAILVLLRLRHNNSNGMAALFGLFAALILYFHYLFGVILPALAICFFVVKSGDRKSLWRQLGVAAAVFALACLPAIPGLDHLFNTGGTHVFDEEPTLRQLVRTVAAGWLPFVIIGIAVMAFAAAFVARPRSVPLKRVEAWQILFCASLALIPLLILYGISIGTFIHIFAPRYRLAAVPGIAFCWAIAVGRFRLPVIRALFCIALVAAAGVNFFTSPDLRRHMPSPKYALEAVEKDASSDNAPVVICSGFVEADHAAMPVNSPKDTFLFAPLSYYKLTVPVVPMPRTLNDEAIRVGSLFLRQATQKHERFFALSDKPSYSIIDWLTRAASDSYDVRNLGVFDETTVLEFVPRSQANSTD